MITVEAATGPGAKRRLPKGWRWCKLDEVGHFESGGTPLKANADYWGGTIPFVTGADITEFYITSKHARAFLTQAGLTSSKTAICHPGTILLVTRTRVGRVGIATETIGASQDLSPYSCCPDLLPEYACWYLKALSDYLSESCRGATIQGLTRDFVQAIDIPLPHLSEQKRIAAILKERLTGVERARAAAETQLEAAKALPAAYLRAIFDSTEAQHWPRDELGKVSEITGGIQKTPERAPVRFHKPYLTVRNVQRGYLDLSNVERFEVSPDELSRLRLLPGDILIVEGNGSLDHIGRNALFFGDGEDWIHQNHIIRVRLRNDICSPEFVSRFLNSDQGRSQMIEKAQTTSGLYTLSAGKVSSLAVPIPPLAEQRTMTAMLIEKMAAVERLQKALEERLGAINQSSAAILLRAFSGEL